MRNSVKCEKALSPRCFTPDYHIARLLPSLKSYGGQVGVPEKEWLDPKPKGFIPELSDAGDLMWIEQELARKGLSAEKRAALEKLRDKALNGTLRSGELNKWRKKTSGDVKQSLKSFLSKFRFLLTRSSQVKSMPPEALAHLDSAIEIIRNALALLKAGFEPEKGEK